MSKATCIAPLFYENAYFIVFINLFSRIHHVVVLRLLVFRIEPRKVSVNLVPRVSHLTVPSALPPPPGVGRLRGEGVKTRDPGSEVESVSQDNLVLSTGLIM